METAELLISSGAKLNTANRDGDTELIRAARNGSYEHIIKQMEYKIHFSIHRPFWDSRVANKEWRERKCYQ